ncbi:MAG: RHS repeat-associated core domain-containing protein, partial [Candidatus Promineifilaceae bacterium]
MTQLINLILVIGLVLPTAPAKTQIQDQSTSTPSKSSRAAIAADPFGDAVPIPVSLPSGLEFNTFDGSLSLSGEGISIPHANLPLSFSMSWDSDEGWTPKWKIFFVESRYFLSGGASKKAPTTSSSSSGIRSGVTFYLEDRGPLSFDLNSSGSYDGPEGYTVTDTGGDHPAYTLRTPEGIVYYFDNPYHRHVTKIENTAGQYLQFSYESGSSTATLTKIADTYGRSLTLDYNSSGFVTLVTDANSSPVRKLVYTYDSYDRLISSTDPLGNITQYSSADNLLYQLTDPSGGVTTIQYKSSIYNDQQHGKLDRSRAVQVSTPAGSFYFGYEYVGPWDAYPNVTEVTTVRQIGNGQEAVTTYEYLGGLPVKITNAEGGIETMTWDSDRRMTAITDENNHTTSFEYDERGNYIAITNPLSQTVHYTYEPEFNKISSIIDPNGNVTSFTYDPSGHLLTQTDPLSQTIHYNWSEGRLESITDPLNQTTHFGFNEYGYPTAITDTLGFSWSRTFDTRGTLTSQSDPSGNTYTFSSDALGKLTKNTDPLGYSSTVVYDSLGAPTKITDPNGNIARYQYDAAGRTNAIVDPQGGMTKLTYDALGNLTSVVDPAGSSTSFGFDKLGRMTSVTDSLGETMTYTYDDAGNITSRTDAQGRTSTYLYDAANRMIGVDYPSSSDVVYEYDPAGRLIKESNGDVEMNYTYDAANQLLGVRIEPFGKVISYTYDAAGRRATMTDPDGGVTTYSYDDLGQLESVTDPQSRTTNFAWDPGGRLIGQEFASGATISYTVDAVGQVLEQWSNAPGGGSLLSREYSYDPAGNRLSVTDQDGETTTYTYDALSQLTGAAYSVGGSISYTYDPAGNRTDLTDSSGHTAYSYDSANRLVAMGSTTYSYDEDGNRTGKVDSSGSVSYTYNEENLLAGIQPAGEPAVTFSYYPDGRRLSRTDASGTTYYFYDNYNVLLESNASGVTTARYTSWSVDRWITQDRGGQSYDYLQDPQISTIGLLDSTGNLAAAYEYEPFGGLRSSSGSVPNPYLFAGRRYEDGWYYNRMRMYDPVTGRFAAEDPAGMPDGPNRYLYALNNPTTYIDPFGLACGTPSTFGECHAACMKYFNPAPVQLASAVLGALGTGATRKATDWSSRLLAGSTAKDWLAAAHKPKEPWWSAGISSLVGVVGTVLAKTQIIGQVLATGVVAGPTAIAGAALVGWGAGTFVGCSISCASDRDNYNFAITCDRYRRSSQEELPELPKPPDDPGNDHPDENYSAASPLAPDLGSPVYRDRPYIGLLWRGYAEETGALINQIGELYERVDTNFNPELVETVPVLVIPSGGLYGIETSGSFRARLAAYVEAGGTIVSFAQQQGIQFSALPVPASGDTLGGYGWREDSSCFRTSLYLSNYHQMLSGFSKPTLDAHVDGYFTSLPDGATELLNRMKNGQPGLIYYRYPAPDQGGYVLATPIYDDWGGTNRQVSQDARILIRDILSWAFDPSEVLAELDPGQLLDLPLEVVNETSQDAAKIEFTIRRPDRGTAYTTIVDVGVPANGTTTTNITWPTPGSAQLGIWWIEYALLDSAETPLQDRAAGGRFVISDPSPITDPDRDLFLSITSPFTRYPKYTEGEYTFHVYNQSDTAREVVIRYGLPHHTWESYDPSYGNFDKLTYTMTVAADSEATYVYTPTVFTTDRLWASLYEDGELRDKAHFAVYILSSPEVRTNVNADKELYSPNDDVIVTTVLNNHESVPYDVNSEVKIVDPSGLLVYQTGFASAIESQGSFTKSITYSLPADAPEGFYTVQAQTMKEDIVDEDSTRFEVAAYAVQAAVVQPAYYQPDSDNAVSFLLENVGIEDVSSGLLTVTLKSPSGAAVYSSAQPFTVDVGQSVQLDFDVAASNEFGFYHLEYVADYHGRTTLGTLNIPYSNIVGFAPGNERHKAGLTSEMQFDITNSGRFEESPDIRLEVPAAAYSQTLSLGAMLPGETLSMTFDVPLPVSLTTGDYPVTVTLSLPSGSEKSWNFDFFIPPSQLEFSASPTAVAGDLFTITLS